MSNSKSQAIFRRVVRYLPQPITCSIDRLSPGLWMRLAFGIQERRTDDIFVVSYPRSGNTWTRYILAYLKAGTAKQLTATDVGNLTPTVYANIPQANSAISPRFIKTHEPLLHLYPRSLFIHRDPRESLVSYWHFARRTGIFDGSFSEFLRSNVAIQHQSWKEHMQAMHRKVLSDPRNIHVVRYDHLLNDFQNTVAKVVEWSGIGKGVDLDAVYKLTAMETMAASDQECNSPFRALSGESFFVDRGKGSDWRNVWTAADLDWLAKDREMISIMEQNGYV